MNNRLIPDWRSVLKRAHSLRWIAAGFIFTIAEAVASAVGDELIPGPKWVRSLVIGVILAAAFSARLLAQKDSDHDA